jgi:DNA-binding protein HU-beta
MTKAELIEKMAKDAGITKVAAGKVYRKTRKGRNPQTGEQIKIKGKNVIKFKASKNFT